MIVRRLVVCAVAGLLSATLLAGPAMAKDEESGSLTCPAGKVVWITERTSAGRTTISFMGGSRTVIKLQWSTSKTRTGLRSTWWRVTTTALMDHQVTGAACQ